MAWYPAGPSRQREAQNAYDELFNRIASATTPDDYEAIVDFIKSKSKYTLICDNALNGPLHIAIRHRKFQLLSVLLSMKALPVNLISMWYGTPLHMCLIENIDIQVLEELIAAGANVNTPNRRRETPLHLAMKCDHRYAHLLIRHGALDTINARAHLGRTPLHYAVTERNLDNVFLLLYYNADANIEDIRRQTPFTLSIRDPENSIQEILLEYENSFLVEKSEYQLDTFTQNKLYKLLDACISYKNLEMFKKVWSRISPDIRELILDESPHLIVHASFDYIEFVLRNGCIDLTKLLEFCPAMRVIWKTAACEDTDKQVKMFVDTVYLFLSYGGIFSVGDIQFLQRFQHYETIKKLSSVILFTDIDMRFESVLSDIPYIIPYVMCNIYEHFIQILHDYCYQFFTCAARFPYTPSIFEEVEDNMQQFFRFASSDRFLTLYRQIITSPLGITWEIPELIKVPSLLELSRNRAKDRICERYNIRNACQFYTILEALPMIPTQVKDIIAFRYPIYEEFGCKIFDFPSE